MGHMPWLKNALKRKYQQMNFLFFRKGYSFSCEYPMESFGSGSAESFFGYYDKSPVNDPGRYLLYHETTNRTVRKPDDSRPIDLVLYDMEEDQEAGRWSTRAYNWQQGAKPMWISGTEFLFNDYDEVSASYFARWIDITQTENERRLLHPVYDSNHELAYTLNFDRLCEATPDYGYRNRRERHDLPDNANDGIFIIDLRTGEKHLAISLKQMMDLREDEAKDRNHHINHIMLSPDGEHIIFLYRWIDHGMKHDALYLADKRGMNLKCLADDGMVSHCYWADPTTIVAYMRDKRDGDRYFSIDISTGSRQVIGKGVIDVFGDGHPSVKAGKLLFDTYPDRSRMKGLYIFSFGTNKIEKIGEFLEPLRYHGETRCDLHPRFDPSGNFVFVDSVHEGKRMLYKIQLK